MYYYKIVGFEKLFSFQIFFLFSIAFSKYSFFLLHYQIQKNLFFFAFEDCSLYVIPISNFTPAPFEYL